MGWRKTEHALVDVTLSLLKGSVNTGGGRPEPYSCRREWPRRQRHSLCKPDDPSSIPRSHGGERTDSRMLSSDLHLISVALNIHTHTHPPIIIILVVVVMIVIINKSKI